MPRRLLALAVSAAFLVPALAHASTWRYRFQAGHDYRYHYTERTTIDARMPMMGAHTEHLAMDTDFAIHVDRVLPDGRYDTSIHVLAVRLKKADGQTVTLSHLPAAMRTVRATITRRGRFEFYRKVVVQVRDHGAYALAMVDARHGTASASASAGGETVTATATIDPRTGRVSARIEHHRARPHTHAETRARPAQALEVLPARVLSLMALPAGPVHPGDHFDLDTPAMKVHEAVLAPARCGKAQCGRLKVTAHADASTAATGKTAVAAAPQGEQAGMQADMNAAGADMKAQMAGMGGMPGMGSMPGMGGGAAGGMAGGTPSMTTTITATMAFDPAKGNLATVEGRAESDTDAGGLKVKTAGTFSLAAR